MLLFLFYSYVKSHLNNNIWIHIYNTTPVLCNILHQTQCIRNSIFPHFVIVNVYMCVVGRVASCGCVSVHWMEGKPRATARKIGFSANSTRTWIPRDCQQNLFEHQWWRPPTILLTSPSTRGDKTLTHNHLSSLNFPTWPTWKTLSRGPLANKKT